MRDLQLASFCLTVGVCFMAPIKRPASGVPDADVAWLQHSECALAMPEALLRLQNEEACLQRAGAYATMDDIRPTPDGCANPAQGPEARRGLRPVRLFRHRGAARTLQLHVARGDQGPPGMQEAVAARRARGLTRPGETGV
ncbi:hypothetical protein M885DRAFT_544530 [Pelagophyceae sp. CCMP2097]|nr:hypothetical protein M885DRAFT_544530 [Pelagophyceae sp. CCMP2097]